MHRRAHLGFTLAVGALGWGALAATAFLPVDAAPASAPLLFVLFVAVILAARAMAFRLVPESVLSLDSAFYVVAAICLGAVPAGRLVALALTIDALLRLKKRDLEELAYVFYFGGMTGALVTASGSLLAVDRLDLAAEPQLAIAARVLGVGAALLASHYAIQGVRSVLGGRAPKSYLRQVALPGILSEASLIPAAVVLVLLYRPHELLPFALVCATYLLVNFVFNRLSSASLSLRARVRELEILDTTARRLAASLQLQELVDTVARETMRAIPEAEALMLVHGGDKLVVDAFDGEQFSRHLISRTEGATG